MLQHLGRDQQVKALVPEGFHESLGVTDLIDTRTWRRVDAEVRSRAKVPHMVAETTIHIARAHLDYRFASDVFAVEMIEGEPNTGWITT